MSNKIIVGIILATLIIIFGGVWWSSQNQTEEGARLEQPMMGEKMPDMGAQHVARDATHPPYGSNPPTSGWHWAGVAGAGFKDEAVPDELVLHSMEHGAAVVWYRADLPESEVERIKGAFNEASGKKIMLPRTDLDVPVALTSWGYLLKQTEINEAEIKEFIARNNDRAPEKAPI